MEFFGWLQVINPQTGFDSTVVAAIIACIARFCISSSTYENI